MDLRSGAAFWPLKNGLIRAYPPIERDEVADVAVIGAGITGALAAYRLTMAGANVVVLDKRDVASGSTAATTGLLQYETDTSLTELSAAVGEARAVRAWALGVQAIDAIEGLCQAVGDASGFARRSSLYLASSRRDSRQLAIEWRLRRRHGFDVDWTSASDLKAQYGIDAPGAISARGNAQIDCHRFTHALFYAAMSAGARVYDRTEARAVRAHDDGVSIDTDRGPVVRARRVVWAAGYEAVEETQRGVGSRHSTWAFVSEPVADFGPWRDGTLIWETARPYLYARTTDDGRVMVGGEDEAFSRRHDNDRLRPKKTRQLLKRFERLFPTIPLEPAYEWSGVFTTTKDGLPYIGSVPEHPHAWLALGYGGNGITFSMIAADLIRDAWLGRPSPDAHIFAFER
jgi:glycine/D-amino acid oxidase-like deaminating enzyme